VRVGGFYKKLHTLKIKQSNTTTFNENTGTTANYLSVINLQYIGHSVDQGT